jgi:hypothetical protein
MKEQFQQKLNELDSVKK